MSSSCCWSCFSKLRPSPSLPLRGAFRLPVRQPTTTTATSAFHTSSILNALPAKKSKSQEAGPKYRESRATRVVRKTKANKHLRRTPDERKAISHRIILTNNNALEVPSLRELSASNLSENALKGEVVALPGTLQDQLKAVQAFKRSQGWSFFRRPCVLMREETIELAQLMGELEGGAAEEKKERSASMNLVTGDRGTGKSVHLLQAAAMAFLKNWVVVTIPDAIDQVNGTTAYAPIPNSDPPKYFQKDSTAQLLKRIVDGSGNVLDKLHISQHHAFLKQHGISLLELAMMGVNTPETSWQIFLALWSELTATGPSAEAKGIKPFTIRPPVLVTVDNIAHWMTISKYHSAEYQPIHAHELSLVDHFLSLLTQDSKTALPNGGMLLYATSTSNSLRLESFELARRQLVARNAGIKPGPPEYPMLYTKLDERVTALFDNAKELRHQKLSGLPKDETRSLLEYYARSGVLRQRVDQDLVGEKWALAACGVVGELERLSTRLSAIPVPRVSPTLNVG
ncbi:37S ribosomal protein S23 mitochondrial [Myotisia sp. PD_48]|nr:37S ribosomal protein S23 mitochondrial [Myotisia sp. PD_48]